MPHPRRAGFAPATAGPFLACLALLCGSPADAWTPTGEPAATGTGSQLKPAIGGDGAGLPQGRIAPQ